MKSPLFDYIFLVVYVSVSVIAHEASVANTTEGSTKENSTNKADTKMLVCILFSDHLDRINRCTCYPIQTSDLLGHFYLSFNN